MKAFFIVLSVLVGLFRPVLLFKEFNHHIESSYQAIAHILVGVLLCLWLTKTDVGDPVLKSRQYQLTYENSAAILIILTIIEVVCVVASFLTL